MQQIISGKGCHKKLKGILGELRCERPMLVCDSAFEFLNIKDYFSELQTPLVKFSDFSVNPLYEDVFKGVQRFNSEGCDGIIAVGGGSTVDVAKCIKLFCKLDSDKNYLHQQWSDSGIPLIALPTTAGTGSESTKYAVIYYDSEKQSVTHESIIPDYAILEPYVLKTLPEYQKKCTLLDALCQSIEAWWSVNSTEKSREYSKTAIGKIMKNYKEYIFHNTGTSAEEIMLGANLSGKAINITQTTAPHAMSYKLTSLYSIPHGHAVAICLPPVFEYMWKHPEKCSDPRGEKYLKNVFQEIAEALGCENVDAGIKKFKALLKELNIFPPRATEKELKNLAQSVNTTRLKNNPVTLSEETLYMLYKRITGEYYET